MEFFDTHCHIHEATPNADEDDLVQSKWAQAGLTDPLELIKTAAEAGVTRLICVGCTLRDSKQAVELARDQANCWASIGIHPHEAKDHRSPRLHAEFAELAKGPKVIAIGECGLDYYYSHSPKDDQKQLLKFQLEVAEANNLPVIFHVRDAFDDFWPIYDQFPGIKGVIHSFTAGKKVLDQILSRGLYVGLNGIMTFTKDQAQLEAAKAVPLDSLLLETDAPFLTPGVFRGTICQPKHVVQTAEFLAELRGEGLAEIAGATTANARKLFNV